MILDRDHLEAALPGYSVSRLIASGGFGLVFAGRHLRLDRPVAIKILLPGADAGAIPARETFAAEARLLERLAHPHIVRVHDYVEFDDLCMIVMEHCDGGTLRPRVQQRPPALTAVGIGIAVATALELAHRAQVIHRDIKPENILFTSDGTPKVSDFGIAKIVECTGAAANTVVGTPVYMAPEQFTGEQLRPATDLYSLATVLYELLSGRTPFARGGAAFRLADQHLHESPPPLGVPAPPEIAAVIMRALRKDPRQRPPTAAVFAADLAAAAAGAFGASWLDTCAVPIHLTDDIGVAAHRSPPYPRAGRPSPFPRPGEKAAGHGERDGADDPTVGPGAALVPPPTAAASSRPVSSRGGARAGSGSRARWPGRRGTRKGKAAGTAAPWSLDYPIDSPFGVAVAPDNTLIVSQPLLHRVSRIQLGFLDALSRADPIPEDLARNTVVIAGTGKAGRSGDGGPALDAELDSPAGVAVAPDGSVLIADSLNDRLRRVSPDGRISTDRTALAAPGLHRPSAVAVGADGVCYLADSENHRVWRIEPGREAHLVAGSGTPGFAGDGGPATAATLNRPQALAVDARGRLLIADQGNRRIRRVDRTGRIDTIAGTAYGGRPASTGGPALALDIGSPDSLAVGPDAALYLVDAANNQVLVIAADAMTHVLAGRRGPVPVADPRQVAIDPDGNVYIAQPSRHRITIIPRGGGHPAGRPSRVAAS